MTETKATGSRVEFRPPKDFVSPEHEGDTFDVVCTFAAKEDGQLCLTHLGDTPMPGYGGGEEGKEEGKEHAAKPDYSEYTGPMMAQMAGGQAGSY